MIKIIICTTFRDFKGTDNDNIQYMFLENLKKQTYQNFLLVTTTFGEKNVKEVVDSYLKEKSFVRNVELPKDYRFSLTDVVLSAVDKAEEIKNSSIIVWCTCDVQFEPTFFQTLVDNYQVGVSGIVHPNIQYRSISDLQNHKGVIETLDKGIDILFFDSLLLIKRKKDIEDYRFYDWGVFEYFLVAIAINYSNNRINLFCKTKIRKVVNDRKVTDESKAYFERCFKLNYPVLQSYLTNYQLCDDFHEIIKYNAHTNYKVVDKNLLYRYIKARYLFLTWSLKIHLGRLTSMVFYGKGVKVKH